MSPILGIIASAQQPAQFATSFDSIATVTVGAGGSANVEFTSIPSTYTHLQIRGIIRGTYATGNDAISVRMQVNGDTATNYSTHLLQGYTGVGSGTSSQGTANADYIRVGSFPKDNWTASVFGPVVIDILDYKNTNKYKTIRILGGAEGNSTTVYEYVEFNSGSWRNTNAITSVKLYPAANNFAQYSTFALYGVKG